MLYEQVRHEVFFERAVQNQHETVLYVLKIEIMRFAELKTALIVAHNRTKNQLREERDEHKIFKKICLTLVLRVVHIHKITDCRKRVVRDSERKKKRF